MKNTNEQRFKVYDQVVGILGAIIILSILLTSCGSNRNATRHDPVRTPDNYVKGGSKNCGWAYN